MKLPTASRYINAIAANKMMQVKCYITKLFSLFLKLPTKRGTKLNLSNLKIEKQKIGNSWIILITEINAKNVS